MLAHPQAEHHFREFWDTLRYFQTTWKVFAYPQVKHWYLITGSSEKLCRGVGKSISQHLLGPHLTIFLENSETHWNISDHLKGVCTPTGEALVPDNPWAEHQYPNLGQVEQIHVGVGNSISQHLLGPHTPSFVEIPETHRNIFRLLG